MSDFEVSLRGDREVIALLDQLQGRELLNRTRRGTRAGAAVMRRDLRARVRGGQYPKSFRKIATRSTTHGGVTGLSPATRVGPTSPLHNIFEGGASSHHIAPKSAPVLSNINERYPGDAPFFSVGPVRHPGMAARPLTTPAFEATKDEAGRAASDKILEGLR